MSIQRLDNNVLSYIFKMINETGDNRSIWRCERVCKSWKQTVTNLFGPSSLRREINLTKKRISVYPWLLSRFNSQFELIKDTPLLDFAQKNIRINMLNGEILLTMIEKKIADINKFKKPAELARSNSKLQLVFNNQILTLEEKLSLLYYFYECDDTTACDVEEDEYRKRISGLQHAGFNVVPIDFTKNIESFVISYEQRSFEDLLAISSTAEGVSRTAFIWSQFCSALLKRIENFGIETPTESIMCNDSLTTKDKFFQLLEICLRHSAEMKKKPFDEVMFKESLDSLKSSSYYYLITTLECMEI